MKILIYGINYSPEITGIGKYTGELCSWLANKGHEVRVITAPPYYPEWKVAAGYRAYSYKVEVIDQVDVYRCPLYVPLQPNTAARLLHLISFSLSSLPIVLCQFFWKPNVVLVVEPTFFCTPAALILSRISQAKCLLHIQDFELDAMLGLGLGGVGKFSSLVKNIESFVMQRFDAISTISYSMMEKSLNKIYVKKREVISGNVTFDMRKGLKTPVFFFPNWIDQEVVSPQSDSMHYRTLWGVNVETKIILYSGNMGKKQGLEMVLEAAQYFIGQDVLFLMVGAGVACDDLKGIAIKNNQSNVRFYDLQPYKKLSDLLAMADIHLVVQKKGAADAVLPSKLTNILAAGGHALVTAEKETELGIMAESFPGIYTCVQPECLDSFVDAVNRLLEKDLRHTNQVARDYAVKYLAAESVFKRFENDLTYLASLKK